MRDLFGGPAELAHRHGDPELAAHPAEPATPMIAPDDPEPTAPTAAQAATLQAATPGEVADGEASVPPAERTEEAEPAAREEPVAQAEPDEQPESSEDEQPQPAEPAGVAPPTAEPVIAATDGVSTEDEPPAGPVGTVTPADTAIATGPVRSVTLELTEPDSTVTPDVPADNFPTADVRTGSDTQDKS
jgi:hypothetical protein